MLDIETVCWKRVIVLRILIEDNETFIHLQLRNINFDLETETIASCNENGANNVEPLANWADAKNLNFELVPEKVLVPDHLKGSVNDKSLSKIKAEDAEQMRSYKKVMEIFGYLEFLFGIKLSYDWKMGRNFMFWVMSFSLSFAIFSIPYTVYVHYKNGDYARILEPLAIKSEIFLVHF